MTCIAKCSQDLKCSVSLLHSIVGKSAVCDCDISRSNSLFSKHRFFKPDKILGKKMAKVPELAGKIY